MIKNILIYIQMNLKLHSALQIVICREMELVKIRKKLKEEMKKALELVWKVFLEYEAPDYTEEGIKEFKIIKTNYMYTFRCK